MVNVTFWVAVLAGFASRAVSGRIISIAAGLVVGVLLSELWKFLLYYLKA